VSEEGPNEDAQHEGRVGDAPALPIPPHGRIFVPGTIRELGADMGDKKLARFLRNIVNGYGLDDKMIDAIFRVGLLDEDTVGEHLAPCTWRGRAS
jgi:hypothetical protein